MMIGLVSFLSVTQYNCLIMKRKESVQVLLDVLRRVRGSKWEKLVAQLVVIDVRP